MARILIRSFLAIAIFFTLFAWIEYADDLYEGEVITLAKINSHLSGVLFFDVSFGAFSVPEVTREGEPVMDEETGKQKDKPIPFPLIVAILAFGALFFTLYYRFINIRGFKHAIDIVRGKYDKEDTDGEVSHFRALTSALSATIGLGNIAGVAIAIQLGGPGAVFWMLFLAVFGMSAKFSSCTLGQLYRRVNADGSISGGPMYYLDIGLKDRHPMIAKLGKFLAILFAIFVMGGAIGGGNMFQTNQTVEAFTNTFELGKNAPEFIGIIMAILVSVVILGGIRRIGSATSKIVPIMCGIYILAALAVIISNISAVPAAIMTIISGAFSDNAFFGGIIGVLVMGFRRASFSNEAGLGSAAIAHAAAKTQEPVREGLVAMLGPFIDTIVVCAMTSMVIVVTGVWSDPAYTTDASNIGVTLTSAAFGTVLPWFPVVLTICIALFAYSTIISWCYYGERGWIYLLDHFGEGIGLATLPIFRIVFIFTTYIGAVNSLSDVITFTDLMILSLALPNIVGSLFLVSTVKKHLNDYWSRYRAGEFN